MSLRIVPMTRDEARAFVQAHHRHNKPPPGCKFAVGVKLGDALVGVAMAGRPVARELDNGLTLEVNRTCTLGERNANSMLYGAVWRAAKAMGYVRAITYTQGEEDGSSLRAAGFVLVREIAPRNGWKEASVTRGAAREPLQATLLDADPRESTGYTPRRLWEIRAAM